MCFLPLLRSLIQFVAFLFVYHIYLSVPLLQDCHCTTLSFCWYTSNGKKTFWHKQTSRARKKWWLQFHYNICSYTSAICDWSKYMGLSTVYALAWSCRSRNTFKGRFDDFCLSATFTANAAVFVYTVCSFWQGCHAYFKNQPKTRPALRICPFHTLYTVF